jgi:hypothetical protein
MIVTAVLFHVTVDALNEILQMDFGDAVDAEFGKGCVVLAVVWADDGSCCCCSHCYRDSVLSPAVVSNVRCERLHDRVLVKHTLMCAEQTHK